MLNSPAGHELIQGLEETGRTLVTEFTDLDEASATTVPDPEEWSAKQNIAHLSEIEPGLIDEALAIIADPDTPIGHPPGALWGEAQNAANDRPLADLVREFDAVNQDTLQRLTALTDADLVRSGKHRGFGNATVQSTLMMVLAHRRGHIFQHRSNLISLRARQAGRVPSEAYAVTGDRGPALVLLDAAASKWTPVATELGKEYRIVHFKYAALPPTIEQLGRDLHLSEFWLAGNASGAVDACKYAFAHPERLTGLVLVNLPVLPFSRDGRPDDFGSIKVPTLTLVGEAYPQAALAQERGRQFPNGRMVVVPGSGRDLPGEQPAAVVEAIRAFVPLTVAGD